jgi:tRNA pseudouridine38-40 synthase
MDRERQMKVADDLHGYHSNSEAVIPLSSSARIGEVQTSNEDVGFGKRRFHRCLVVTARARAFLYHQVGIFLLNKASKLVFCFVIKSCMDNPFWFEYRFEFISG